MDNYNLTTQDDNSAHSLSDFDDIAEGERLMDVYANDVIVKYLLETIALHLVETLLAIFIVLSGFPLLCGSVSSADVCERHCRDLYTFAYFFFGFLLLYSVYLNHVRPRRGLREMSVSTIWL